MPNSNPLEENKSSPQTAADGDEVGSRHSPSVLAQGAEAISALLSDISEGPTMPREVFDTPLDSPTAAEYFEDHDEWHDFEFSFELNNLFEPAHRREAIALLRQQLRERVKLQLKPGHILLRDKITFTLGTLDLLVSAYWLGASPRTFYKLFTVKAVLLLLIRWAYYRVKRWHYYMFDLCYAVQILILVHVWVYPASITLAKLSFAFSLGPLLWSILAFRNSLVYHSLDKVTSLFLHFFPACVAWAHRFYPPEALELSLENNPERRARWERATPWELCFLPMGPYLIWAVLYGLKIFVISSKKIQAKQYETLFNYVTSRQGLFATVVLRFPQKLQPIAYLGLHMALTQVVMALNTIWWSNERAALGFITAAFTLAAWHGASFYFNVFVHRYLAGLGLEPKKKASPAAVHAAGENGKDD